MPPLAPNPVCSPAYPPSYIHLVLPSFPCPPGPTHLPLSTWPHPPSPIHLVTPTCQTRSLPHWFSGHKHYKNNTRSSTADQATQPTCSGLYSDLTSSEVHIHMYIHMYIHIRRYTIYVCIGVLCKHVNCVLCSVCVYYAVYVCTMQCMCVLCSVCVCYAVYVCTMQCMCVLRSVCVYYAVYVCATQCMCVLCSVCVCYAVYVCATQCTVCVYIHNHRQTNQRPGTIISGLLLHLSLNSVGHHKHWSLITGLGAEFTRNA